MNPSIDFVVRQHPKRAVIVDLDGTLAFRNQRDPYDEHLSGEDAPNTEIIELVRLLGAAGHPLLIVSGRSEKSRPVTRWWLHHHLGVPTEALFMRGLLDHRPDWQVKAEIYELFIKPKYGIFLVLDDRAQTVDFWRSVGLTCLQVAPGDF